MIIVACEIELIIYNSNSLKDKRHVIKSIINRIKERYNVAIGETDYLDKWNRSEISVVTVSNAKLPSEKTIDKVIGFIEKDSRVEIIHIERYVY
jgi:hypothetical protein